MEKEEIEEIGNDTNKWHQRKFFFRQLIICSGGWCCYFIMGMMFGASTVFIPQIRKEANSTEAVTESMASWIPSIMVYAGLPWSFILPIVMNFVGRKWTFMFVCCSNLVAFTIFYFATSINMILISEVINGINTGSHFTVSVMIITEYTSPKHRGLFLTLKSAILFWGIFMSNAIGTFFHWKNIGLVCIIISIYSIFVAFILPESPFWLATKQQYDKCAVSHRFVIGDDRDARDDLEKLINYQKHLNKNTNSDKFVFKAFVVKYFKAITSKQIYKPILLCMLIDSLYMFSGKVIISVYALDIINKITAGQNVSAYTVMLILDGVSVLCMYVGCAIVKFYPRKKLLVAFTAIGIAFLLTISVYTYLIKLAIFAENNYVALVLLIGYSISVCLGPVILTQTISAELISVELRGFSSCVIDISLKLFLGTLLKISPYLFKLWGTHGAFLFYGLSTSVTLFLVCKFLPETKDKTLQEIAEFMKGNKKSNNALQEMDTFLENGRKLET